MSSMAPINFLVLITPFFLSKIHHKKLANFHWVISKPKTNQESLKKIKEF